MLAHGQQPIRDCFASAQNKRFAQFWDKDDEAFTKSWSSGELLWMNPPFSMIPRVLEKIEAENANVVLIAPEWTRQPWWPKCVAMAGDSWVLPYGPTFQLAGTREPLPPRNWRVIAFRFY